MSHMFSSAQIEQKRQEVVFRINIVAFRAPRARGRVYSKKREKVGVREEGSFR